MLGQKFAVWNLTVGSHCSRRHSHSSLTVDRLTWCLRGALTPMFQFLWCKSILCRAPKSRPTVCSACKMCQGNIVTDQRPTVSYYVERESINMESSTEFLPSVIGEHCRRGKVGVMKPIRHLESKAHQINQSSYGPTEDEPGKHRACMDLR